MLRPSGGEKCGLARELAKKAGRLVRKGGRLNTMLNRHQRVQPGAQVPRQLLDDFAPATAARGDLSSSTGGGRAPKTCLVPGVLARAAESPIWRLHNKERARFENPLIPANPLFSPRGEAKCVRGASVRDARRLTSGGVLGQYGEQAQRSNGEPIACFGRQVVRNAG